MLILVYGYARVSTKGQAKDGNSLEFQEKELKENGVEIIFKDSYTGSRIKRPEFDKLMNLLESGDKLVVAKLDRFARSTRQGTELVQQLLAKGVSVHVLNMGLIDNSPTGKLITHIMFAFAEFERDMIIERTQEGKAIAKQDPDFREGRPKKFDEEKMQYAMELLESNSYAKVAKITGISKSTLSRAKRELLGA